MSYRVKDLPEDRGILRFHRWLKTFSVGTRSLIYIFPGLIILAIPAVLGYVVFKQATIAHVPLNIWAVWLGVCWFSLFASRTVVFMIGWILGRLTIQLQRYVEYIQHLHFYISLCAFFCVAFLSFAPIMVTYNAVNGEMLDWQHVVQKILTVLLIASGIVTLEKLLLQVVAVKFHETTYKDRIDDSKYKLSVLATLYTASKKHNSVENPNSHDEDSNLKKIISQTRGVLEKTSSVLGKIASEITGHQFSSSEDQVESEVLEYLTTRYDAEMLGRYIFKTLCPGGRNYLLLQDIRDCFATHELTAGRKHELTAEEAFDLLDKDGNGDVSNEQMTGFCVEMYRERKAIAASMRDLDHAVGKLDSILMAVIYVIVVLIFIAFFNVSFQTYITTAGTIVLGLSFMIGSTARAFFECIIFLFAKHPFDVGDRITIEGENFLVKEMTLLTTVLIRTDGRTAQVANDILAQKFIYNIRRSGQMKDEVEIEVDFYTSLEQIEELRERMNQYLEGCDRDFYPTVGLTVEKIHELRQLILKVTVEHKSNWQDEGVTARRRNKFMCQLKNIITELDIQGPFVAPALPLEKMIVPHRPLRKHLVVPAPSSPGTDLSLGAKSDIYNVEDKETRLSAQKRKARNLQLGSDDENEGEKAQGIDAGTNNGRKAEVDIIVTNEDSGNREKELGQKEKK